MHIFYDIGGTSTRIGLSKDGTSLDSNMMFSTVGSFELGIKALIDNTVKLLDSEKAISICVGLPGTLNKEKTALLHAPHLRGWEGKDVTARLKETFNCHVYAENDAALVGLGEAVYGSGRGYNIVAYVTLSTGVGGAKIESGKIDANSIGFEIGHHILESDSTFEDLVSGTAIEERYGKKPKEIEDSVVWENYTDIVARGISNVVRFWSPDIVVIGGSMARSVLFDRLNIKTKELCTEYDQIPAIVKAELDTVGGLYGGLATLLNK